MKLDFNNKKIGIWGYGIVGKSAHQYFKNKTPHIKILSQHNITVDHATVIIQSAQSINHFFKNNDYVIISPGIPLHDYYEQYKDKIISEVDILAQHKTANIIAITGTLGKTSITSLLTSIIKKHESSTIAAGNIGFPMLNCTQNQYQNIILELSSFQLQYNKSFAPDLAIITNFYSNHLDYHKTIDEYLQAKLQIIKHQRPEQKTLLPYNLLPLISKHITPQPHWIFFAKEKPLKPTHHTIYFLENNTVCKMQNNVVTKLVDITPYTSITFIENLLIIAATLDLQNIPLQNMRCAIKDENQKHRLEKITSIKQTTFFNDSKSTVWQATAQALQSMDNKPIKLFLGGLSKGVDRSPLFAHMKNKNIEVYAFGAESQNIFDLCKKYNIACHKYQNLDTAFQVCTQNISQPNNILFSPAGASFDLFENYKKRGDYFIKLVKQYESVLQNIT